MNKTRALIGLAVIAVAIAVAYFAGSGGAGFVQIDASGFHADVELRGGWPRKAVTVSQSEPAKAPAATYRARRVVLRVEEGSDKWWSLLVRRGPWGDLATVKVVEQQTTTLALGPPLTIDAGVKRKGRAVSIGLSVIGRAGEHYGPQLLSSDGPSPPPRLKIMDETGNILASGKFEYG
jgi:hypothetical protein